MPASKELRVRVEEKKKSIKRVLSSSSREGRSSPHCILRSKASRRTVSSSSLVHSWVLIKSLPRRFVFMIGFPFSGLVEQAQKAEKSAPTLVGHDPRAGLAVECSANGFGHGDQSGAATLLQIVDDSAYFGTHTAFREVAFIEVAPGFAERNGIQVLLVGFVVVERRL